MSGADSLRFVGKIYGTKSDYWLCAGRLNQAEEAPTDSTVEPRGTGVNSLVYWVTDNLLNDWIQLPDCKPQWIVQARKIRHSFSGDLNSGIESNPQFDGQERHLLRATLARIFASTAIVPAKMYTIDEETNEMKFDEEFVMGDTETLKALTEWGNVHPIILQGGRTTHLPPANTTNDPEFDADAELAKLQESDPTVDRFRDIEQHEGYGEGRPSWISKVVGDTQQYNQAPPKEGTVSYAVNVIKSLRWPGAVTVAKGGKFTNIYVGYGLKKGASSYNPIEPPPICDDPEEDEEKPEPNPKDAPPEKAEIDTDADQDDENKDE